MHTTFSTKCPLRTKRCITRETRYARRFTNPCMKIGDRCQQLAARNAPRRKSFNPSCLPQIGRNSCRTPGTLLNAIWWAINAFSPCTCTSVKTFSSRQIAFSWALKWATSLMFRYADCKWAMPSDLANNLPVPHSWLWTRGAAYVCQWFCIILLTALRLPAPDAEP